MKLHQIIRQKSRSLVRLASQLHADYRENGLAHAVRLGRKTLKGITFKGKRGPAAPPSEFDRQYGVQTAGIVRVAAMDIEGPNYAYAVYYRATEPELLRAAIAAVTPRPEAFTFVDYGSGKGLALMVASEFAFRAVVGVEFAKDLHQESVKNLAAFAQANPRQLCRQVQAVCGDAVEFPPPAGPLLCHFYDPFEDCILEKVLDRLAESNRADPREIIVVYRSAAASSAMRYEEAHRQALFASKPFLERVGVELPPDHTAFRLLPVSGATAATSSAPQRVAS